MNKHDHKKFLEIMTGLVELYGRDISDALLTIYWSALSDIDIDELTVAVSKHVLDPEQGMFFPKPAHIINQLYASKESIADTIELEALEAWGSVLDDVRRVGTYGKCSSEDENVLSCIRIIGGWNKICMSTSGELTWMSKEFINLYSLKKTSGQQDGLLKLPSGSTGSLEGFKINQAKKRIE